MIRIRTMTNDDLSLGMRLKEQAGWNQLEADWRRALELEPEGCFRADVDGTPVGTTTTCIFGDTAWIALVLVDAAVRGRGVGSALLDHALAYLDARGIPSVRLDATPLGQPLYEKLGFVAQFSLARYAGILPVEGAEIAGVELARAEHLADVVAFDRAVTGTDRHKLFARLHAEQPEGVQVLYRGGKLAGFVAARAGSRATQLGPCLATPEAGPALLAHARRRYAGQPVFIDVPLDNPPAVAAIQALGLTEQRRLLRMTRGAAVHERLEQLWASFGPEKG